MRVTAHFSLSLNNFAKFDEQYTITVPGRVLILNSYTAPELLVNSSLATSASDIYSLGVLWYHLANLPMTSPPFDPKNALIQVDELVLPERAKAALKKMIAQYPTDRYQNVNDILGDLKQLREEANAS